MLFHQRWKGTRERERESAKLSISARVKRSFHFVSEWLLNDYLEWRENIGFGVRIERNLPNHRVLVCEATMMWNQTESTGLESSREEICIDQPLKDWSLSAVSDAVGLRRELCVEMRMKFLATMLVKNEDSLRIDMKLEIRTILDLHWSADMISHS
jgi:hypothetical protein